ETFQMESVLGRLEIVTVPAGAKISVEDDGTVYVASNDAEAANQAITTIKVITMVPEPGMIFEGPVVRIESFGAFVELAPGKDGLCHISELTPERLGKTEDYCHLGDILKVKVKEISDDGKIRLTHKEFCDRSKIKVSPGGSKRQEGSHKKQDSFKITFRDKK
ncbi:MAG: S1 RNA-binding domain-containing protein, partial [Abditibacteriota bacterium]|nr:S1 RNA-binding domain-containing protein [Abditibacteriota bacterium]